MTQYELLSALANNAELDLVDPRIDFLGDGCDHDNYLVDGRFVMRVPKSDEVGQRLATEVALLSMLRDAPIDVPRPIGPLRSSVLPWPYCIYGYLEGVEGDLAKHIDIEYAVRAFGQMIAYVHQIPVQRAQSAGLLLEDDAKSRVVVHNDLWGEHILIDPQSGRVTGVIDWADACIGDPARDYAGLLGWLGESFLVRVLESGGISFDDNDLERARAFTLDAGLESIALGRQMGKPRWVSSGEAALKNCRASI
jgi:hypothetical protein